MDQQQIVKYILENSTHPKGTLKKSALEQGVTEEEFEKAWKAAMDVPEESTLKAQSGISSTNPTEKKLFWAFLATTIAAVIINAYYAIFIYKGGNAPWWMDMIGYISNFTDAAVALHIGSRILGIRESFYKSIGVAIFGAVLASIMEWLGTSIIFFSIGIIIIIAMFTIIMRVYNIGFLKALLLIIIQAVIMTGIIFGMLAIGDIFRTMA
jgi:hypothetical protein